MPVFDLTNDMQLITARSLNDIYSERLGTNSSSDLRINATHGNYMTLLLLRLPVGRGGVINSPRFCFFFPCRKSAHRSWVRPLCIVWATTLNSISSGICHQNTQFNMYTTTSKQQEGCTFEDSHPKCFITTNLTAKLSRGAVNRGDVHVLRASYTKVNSNTSILISFDTTDYRCYMVIVRYRSVCVQRK